MGLLRRILATLRLLFCIVNNLYAIPIYLACYFILQPVKFVSPSTFWAVEGWLYEKLQSFVALWAQLAGHKVYISGDDISSIVDDECILLPNHQTTGDIPVLMYALRGIRPALRHAMWIMDWILQVLSFGWVGKGHGDCFILQGSDIRKFSFLLKGTEKEIKLSEVDKFKKHLSDVYCARDRKWMILFPEGGFLRKRIEGSQRFSKRNNLPILDHVTIPRTGAVQSIVEVLGVKESRAANGQNGKVTASLSKNDKRLKWIIDVTIGYRDNQLVGIGSWVMGHEGPKNIFIHFRVYEAADLLAPSGAGDNKKISDKWLYDRFIEKENLLKKFYATGMFPGGKLGVKEVKCYTFQTLLGHLFFLAPYCALIYWYAMSFM